MKSIVEQIEKNQLEIVRLTSHALWPKLRNKQESMTFNPHYFYDLTPIIISEGLRIEYWTQHIISFFNIS